MIRETRTGWLNAIACRGRAMPGPPPVRARTNRCGQHMRALHGLALALVGFAAMVSAPAALAEQYRLPLFVSGTAQGQQGVLRVHSLSDESGPVEVYAIDDSGIRSGPATFTLGPRAAAEFDASDLAAGNAGEGLTGGLGSLSGDVRLEIDTALRVELLAYLRSADGTLSVLHDEVRAGALADGGYEYMVPIFNPAHEMAQLSRLRLINPGDQAATVMIGGRDDSGAEAIGGSVRLTLPARGATTLTAQQLEAGDVLLTGMLGAGSGRWRLLVSSDRMIRVVSLVISSTGRLANLSTTGLKGAAPADQAAFGARFAGVEIIAESGDLRTTLTTTADNGFTEVVDSGDVTDTHTGSHAYERTGEDAGRLTLSYDDGDLCAWNLYFTSRTGGWYASRCIGADDPDGVWRGGNWSAADDAGASPALQAMGGPGDQSYTVDTAIPALTLPAATGGDGTLSYSLSPEVPGLSFDAMTRQLTGTPTAAGIHAMTYTAMDGDGDTDTLSFTVRVAADTSGETDLGECHVGLVLRPGQHCTYPGTAEAFSVMQNGRGMFLIISSARAININKVTFKGHFYDFRASHEGDGVWRVDRLAGSTTPTTGGGTDGDATPAFPAMGGPGDQAYTLGAPIDALTLPAATGGDGELRYSLTPQVPGLSFDAATRQLIGTPTAAGTHAMSYTVTDEDGDTDTFRFTITVEEPPVVDTSPAFPATGGPGDQTYTVGMAIAALTLSAATGGDGELTYSLSPNVPGLSFDAATRQLIGTPTAAGTHAMSYTVTDEDGDTDTFHFTITVQEMEGDPETAVLELSGCTDGRYIADPGDNPALVGDCRALVGFAKAFEEGGDLPANHVLRQWGARDQSKLASWTGIEINGGRVTTVRLRSSQLKGSIPPQLGQLTGLTVLDLTFNEFIGALPSELGGLTSLTWLSLHGNAIWDLSPLAEMSNLTDLRLAYNRIEDLSPLAGLTSLVDVRMSFNRIEDLSPLEGLSSLRFLSVQFNAIEDISPLAGLTNLTDLYFAGNKVDDLSPLAGLANLKALSIFSNAIEDLSPLAGLTNLRYLSLGRNAIEDLSPLAGLTNLQELSISNNAIDDLSPLSGLTNLQELSVSDNVIDDLSALEGLTSLTRLYLRSNAITDLTPLAGLTNLTLLDLSDNEITDISPLLSNAGLGQGAEIDLRRNPLSDESIHIQVPALTARGVKVTHPSSLVDEFPDSRLTQVYNDNVIVMQVDEDVGTRRVLDSLAAYSTDFYRWFEDEFDYLLFLSNFSGSGAVSNFGYFGIYLSVMNDTLGTGASTFFNSRYGSGGRLRGVIHFPYLEALRSGPALHELLHAWANFSVPTAVGGHWGFSSANGQLGGFDFADLVDLGDGRWTAGRFGTFANGGNGVPYSPIELYFAGLVAREEVPDLWVAEDGEWLEDESGAVVRSDDGTPVFTADNVRTWSIADIVAKNGERNPAMVERPHQRAAVILLVDDSGNPSAEDLQTLSEHAAWLSLQGDDGSRLYSYYEATGGRGSLTLDGLSGLQMSAATPPADLPASFGVPPPPRMTTFDELCGPVLHCAPDILDLSWDTHCRGEAMPRPQAPSAYLLNPRPIGIRQSDAETSSSPVRQGMNPLLSCAKD